jgi:hypothetical protein
VIAVKRYVLEFLFLATTVVLAFAGFWNVYFGAGADPNGYHHMHVVVNLAWLSLLLWQLWLVAGKQNASHRRTGLMVLGMAPLLVASTALLSVESAYKGVVSGEGDFLIIQNVGVTFEVALLVVLAFVLRRRRALHGHLLMGTALLFMGIALFFTLTSFVPGFRVEGPETFYRFKYAGIAGQATCLAVGLLFTIRDRRNGWPMLLAALFLGFNDLVRGVLASNGMIDPLTRFVASLNQPLTFVATLVLMFGLLVATGIRPTASTGGALRPARGG